MRQPVIKPGAVHTTLLRGTEPSEGERDEPADRRVGREAAGRAQRVEAVTHEFVGRNVIPDVAGLRGVDQHVPNEVAELMLRPCDLRVLM